MKIPLLSTAYNDIEGCQYYYDKILTKFDPNIFTYVTVCSHPETYEKIKEIYKASNFIVIPNFSGLGKFDGNIHDFMTGFNFIHNNLEYDYICQTAMDGAWCSAKKVIDICNEMEKQEKTLQLYGDVLYGKKLYYPEVPDYSQYPYNQWGKFYPAFGVGIYSKYFMEKQFDLDIHADKYCLAGEQYISAVIKHVNNLDTEEKMLAFFKKYGLPMDFDRYKVYDPSFIIRQTYFIPDSFVKYGFFSWVPGTYELGKQFVEQHLPLLRESENYPTFQN